LKTSLFQAKNRETSEQKILKHRAAPDQANLIDFVTELSWCLARSLSEIGLGDQTAIAQLIARPSA
jgi:hypothetical protein